MGGVFQLFSWKNPGGKYSTQNNIIMANNTVTLDQKSLDGLSKVVAAHTKELSELARSMQRQLSGMGGSSPFSAIRRTDNGDKEAADELKNFVKALSRAGQTLSATERYQKEAAQREIKLLNDRMRAEEEAKKVQEEHTEAVKDNTDNTEKNNLAVKKASEQVGNFAKGLAAGVLSFEVLNRAVNEFSQAYRQGFNWNGISDSINAALQMGMSPKDMMDFQKRFRRVSNTFEGGIDAFNETVAASNNEWKKYTGSLKEAAVAQGQFYDLALSMGVGSKDMKSAVGGMFNEFKKLQVATSMTAEEFVEMSKSMLSEKSVRDKLVGLQGKERSNYVMKLTDTAFMFQTLGLQKEAAEGLVKMIEQQQSKTFVGRMRESYQAQSIAGIMGMSGSDARELQSLMLNKNKSKDEEARFAQLARDFTENVNQRRNQGGFAEAQIDSLMARAPEMFQTLAGIGDSMSLARGAEADPKALAKQQADVIKRDEGFQGTIIDKLTSVVNILSGWKESMLAILAGAAAGFLAKGAASKVLGRFAGGAAGEAAAGGGGAAGGMSRGGKLLSNIKGGGPIALGVAGVGAVASSFDYGSDRTNNAVSSGAQWAGIGATIGMLGGPIGALIGGAVGGLGGALASLAMNQENANDSILKEKKNLADTMNFEDMKFEMVKRQHDAQIEYLQSQGKLTDENKKKLDDALAEAQKKHDDARASIAGNEMGFNLKNAAATKDWIAQTAASMKNTSMFGPGDVDGVTRQLADLKNRMGAAGVDISDEQLKQSFIDKLIAQSPGLNTDQSEELRKTIIGLKNGQNFDFSNSTMNPLLSKAMSDMLPEVQKTIDDQMTADINTKFNSPEAIAGLKNEVQNTVAQIEKDQKDLAAMQSTPFDETGYSDKKKAEIADRIQVNKDMLDQLQKLANKDNTVKFESEEKLVDVLERLSSNLEPRKGRP